MARFSLIQDELGYGLKDNQSSQKTLRIDFTSNVLQHRLNYGGKKELLLKAVNAKPGLVVWDCTAGLGVDSFLMAAQGCHVTMFERSKCIAILLQDALLRADLSASDASFNNEHAAITHRMRLCQQDALMALDDLARQRRGDCSASALEAIPDVTPDVIYVDPMFPHKKKSARVKGAMQLLQQLLGVDQDADRLLNAAISSGCPRVVVKRPAKGGGLSRQPDIIFAAKSNRFEVFLNPG